MKVGDLCKALASSSVMSVGTLTALLSWMSFFTYVGTVEYYKLKTTAEYAKEKAEDTDKQLKALKDDINIKFEQLRRDIREGENRLSDKIDRFGAR